LDAGIRAIAEAMAKSRSSLIARGSNEAYYWALHNLDVARQLAKCLPVTPPPSADMSAWAAPFTCRDSAMAENVQWALKNEGRGRLLVFAHDAHVMNWKDDEPRWAAVRDHDRTRMHSHGCQRDGH
jgi:erythromycin esterase-like protein